MLKNMLDLSNFESFFIKKSKELLVQFSFRSLDDKTKDYVLRNTVGLVHSLQEVTQLGNVHGENLHV